MKEQSFTFFDGPFYKFEIIYAYRKKKFFVVVFFLNLKCSLFIV